MAYHLDSDATWSERQKSENRKKIESLLIDKVRLLFKKGVDPEKALAKFIFLLPCYSIESWTYQNTLEAAAICKENHCSRCLKVFASWSESRDALDELVKPKEIDTCLKGKNNLRLARQRYPAREVVEVDKSFAEAVESLRSCERLMRALEESRGW